MVQTNFVIISSIAVIVVSIVAIMDMYKTMKIIDRLVYFEKIRAKLISCDLNEKKSKIVIRYEYDYRGKNYISDRYCVRSSERQNGFDMMQITMNRNDSDTIDIYVNPANPQYSVVTKSVGENGQMLGIVMMFGLIAYCIYTILRAYSGYYE